ncbi:hypothetical protein IA57_03315 [Mangrovimonas yunxiaonensis]|uniref:Uncharacterized protein n=1 Tax=Mangrovimonas yunxiaonensis TaxID=1197477 RepID=A0A084TMH5_9FLAO|nr:hypothetical protein [Mangrovimonas yunxiaonensis]KFB01911.1 hypothetical protein IA57_03315 [Mangrovimonas yunxiaonensis]GGH44680.1 hypothetical protein GCM10011364_17620 [Mangrovimonas yunxiaonensis]
MKTLAVTFGFTLFALTAVGQNTPTIVKTSGDATSSFIINTTTPAKKISDTKTTRILLEEDFNRAALLFRAKKSKQEKIC